MKKRIIQIGLDLAIFRKMKVAEKHKVEFDVKKKGWQLVRLRHHANTFYSSFLSNLGEPLWLNTIKKHDKRPFKRIKDGETRIS